MLKKIIYKINAIYRKYWDFPKNWNSDYYNYETDTTDFYKSGKIVKWEKKHI